MNPGTNRICVEALGYSQRVVQMMEILPYLGKGKDITDLLFDLTQLSWIIEQKDF